jgi:aspartyl-tRNA(Asn)/glutamyl-tRNA(Gln) amidotransferase subunit B
MRSKEDAQDYRYFPDPDLLPVEITQQWIDKVRAGMPTLPAKLRDELEARGISAYDANLLTESREKADYFRHAVAAAKSVPVASIAHWVNGELSALANDRGIGFDKLPVAASSFARLVERIQDGTISGKAAKDVLHAMAAGEGEADAIIERRGLKQISDAGAIETAVDAVIAAQAKLVDDYRAGKDKAFNALVGQVMKATQGKANPSQASEILKRKLRRD